MSEINNQDDFWDEYDPPEWEPYEVECAGCGVKLMCDEANLEEGDRWECWPCAEKFDAKEKAEREARREEAPKKAADPEWEAFMASLGPSPWELK